ncbi:MAG: histidinol-phosphate transaminase [Gammaproteobacteria bacterium]
MATQAKLFFDLATPGVRGLRPYEPGKPLDELERELGIRNAVKLASNENPLGPSPKAMAAVREVVPELYRYPDGNGFALKSALSIRHKVPMGSLTLGNGSNDVLEMIARAFLTPDHEAVFSEHAFAVYPIVTQAVGATPRVAPAQDGSDGAVFGHDLEAMKSLVGKRTRVIFVANPNNPTGTWLRSTDLDEFISAMPGHVLVVVDEAYFEYVEEPEYPNTIPWVARYPNLIVTRTFSKAYGLAGLRIGYSVSHPDVADLLNRVRQPFNVNSMAEVAALAALDDESHLQRSRQMNRDGMKQLTEAFSELGLEYIPSVGNFVCVDLARDASQVNESLLRCGVILRPVANYGLPNHLRITVGSKQDNQRVIAALRKALL